MLCGMPSPAAAEPDLAARPTGRARFRLASRGALVRLTCLLGLLCLLGAFAMWMPGRSYRGPLPSLSPAAEALVADLRADVVHLAGSIGERHLNLPEALEAAACYLEDRFAEAGYTVVRQEFEALDQPCRNLIAEIPGARVPAEVAVVGAHYDTSFGTPGADDNASAVAVLLALARTFGAARPERTLRFVAFVNEEYFQREIMGSLVYARACRERQENIGAMLSLEMLGYYTDAPDSQSYPPPLSWFYPSTGNFVAFVGNLRSHSLVRRCTGVFRAHAAFPSEGAALPGLIPGISWSDHWSFWKAGYDAAMVTDTAFFRNHAYHQATDRPETLDYRRMARVADGLRFVVADLAGADPVPELVTRPTRMVVRRCAHPAGRPVPSG
jgi:hypothetical protein